MGLIFLKSYQLEIFADYNQVLLHDEAIEDDISESWSEKAYIQMVDVADGVVSLATARNLDVPIEVVVCGAEPSEDADSWDHVVQCGINLPSGRLIVRGVSDYLPSAKRIELMPGQYSAWLLYGGLDTLSDDGLEGDDHYKVLLWRSSTPLALEVLKNSGFNG